MTKTTIGWTDEVWNPVRGCSMARGSEDGGCLNCYAARDASRYPWGAGFARRTENGPRWTGKVELQAHKLAEPDHWRRPRRVFVNSTSDLFHERLEFGEIAQAYEVMARNPHLTFQVLTKRPERRREFVRAAGFSFNVWPLPNVWEGVSIENRKTAAARIPILERTPAAVRFVSMEPLLEEVDPSQWATAHGEPGHCMSIDGEWWHDPGQCPGASVNCSGACCGPGVDWLVVGGESGPDARPFNFDWMRVVVKAALDSGTHVFCKQAGENVLEGGRRLELTGKGEDQEEWPSGTWPREFPA